MAFPSCFPTAVTIPRAFWSMIWYSTAPVWNQELDSMILMGSFQLSLFYDLFGITPSFWPLHSLWPCPQSPARMNCLNSWCTVLLMNLFIDSICLWTPKGVKNKILKRCVLMTNTNKTATISPWDTSVSYGRNFGLSKKGIPSSHSSALCAVVVWRTALQLSRTCWVSKEDVPGKIQGVELELNIWITSFPA